MPDVPKQDEVRLAVPATPEFLGLARVTAAGLASRLGFSFDQVDDLRLAVDELCCSLIGANGRPGMVRLRYLVADGALEVEGEGLFDGDHRVPRPPELCELSELVLSVLVDEHSVVAGTGHPRFHMVKRRSAPG